MPCDFLEYPNIVDIPDDDVLSYRYFATPVGATRTLFHFSGIICHVFEGGSPTWRRYLARVTLPRQGLEWVALDAVDPARRRVRYEGGTVSVHLASISNLHTAVNAGWAADWATPGTDGNGSLILEIRVAVRDSDGYIHRLGYQAQVLARTFISPIPSQDVGTVPDDEIAPE
jgi:hypothetical protein